MFKKFFYVLLLLLITLLFVGGTNDESSRLSKAIWDTGHLFLFAGLAWVLLDTPYLKRRSALQQFLWLAAFVVLVGGGIEFLQLLVGRYFELMDVLFDALGALVGWLFYRAQSQKVIFFLQVSPLIALSFAIVFQPVWTAYQDEQAMQAAFPLLADFEDATELARWDTNTAQISLQSSHVRHGEYGLEVKLGAAKYPGVALLQLVPDWRDYQYLKLSIYNPQRDVKRLSLKVYDRQHLRNGHAYRDRFNSHLYVNPGWNDFEVSLDDIRSAPKGRQMNMAEIVDVSMFLQDQTQPVVLYLDYLHLSR